MIVYLITNTIDGKRYIGQTIRPLKMRWSNHCSTKTGTYLYRAIQKHGPEAFTIELICECTSRDMMDEIEDEYIERYRTLAPNGYNLARGGRVNRIQHPESRKKISLSLIGTKRALGCKHPHTDETKRKISAGLVGNAHARGYKNTEESRTIRSAANKARALAYPEQMERFRLAGLQKRCENRLKRLAEQREAHNG